MEENKQLNKTTSFSQCNLFCICPRSWYMKYHLKIPGQEDLKYADRGNTVHKPLEKYYNKEITTLDELKKHCEDLWYNKYKLHKTTLKNNKEETWGMIINGVNLNLTPTTNEFKIYFHNDVVGYLDVFDSVHRTAGDYKTSTRTYEKEQEYSMQGKYYTWLVYRKFGYILNEFNVYFLKYTGNRSLMTIKPTMEDIKAAERWHYKVKERMQYFIDNPGKLPKFNQNYDFSHYKHLWEVDNENISDRLLIDIDYYGNYFYIKGNLDDDLLERMYDEFSYEKSDAYYIKKKFPDKDTINRLFSKKYKRLPSGLYNKFVTFIDEVATTRGRKLLLNLNDKRYFDKTVVDMPDKLLTGKILNESQKDGSDYFINNNNHCVLEYATGIGKTLMAAEIIRRLKVKTLIVVNKKDLLYQWKKVLEDELGLDIGMFGCGKKDIKNITVGTIQTLKKNLKEYQEYFGEIRFAIFDESHNAGSDSYYKLSHYLNNTQYRLGLSATAYRTDKSDMKMNSVVGYVAKSVKSKEMVDKGWLMKPTINFIKYDVPKEDRQAMDRQAYTGLINEELQYNVCFPVYITENEYRNNIIKTLVDDNEGKSVLILVKRIRHGEKLNEIIEGSYFLHGETKNKERKEIIEKFSNGEQKILISVTSIFSEGMDVPGLEILINASSNRADSTTVQMIGRILRKKEGKEQALFYDFIDNYPLLRNASMTRMKIFKKEGYKVNLVDM